MFRTGRSEDQGGEREVRFLAPTPGATAHREKERSSREATAVGHTRDTQSRNNSRHTIQTVLGNKKTTKITPRAAGGGRRISFPAGSLTIALGLYSRNHGTC